MNFPLKIVSETAKIVVLHTPPEAALQWSQECRYCHKKNHFTRVCRQKTRAKSTVVVTQDSSSNEDEELDMGTVLHINSSTNPQKASSRWQKVNVIWELRLISN